MPCWYGLCHQFCYSCNCGSFYCVCFCLLFSFLLFLHLLYVLISLCDTPTPEFHNSLIIFNLIINHIRYYFSYFCGKILTFSILLYDIECSDYC